MKYRALPAAVFILFLSYNVSGQNKIEFSYPDDIADSSKKDFVKQFNQGHALYKITCATCHNVTVNKKAVIPDFSLPQLMDYEMRIYPQHAELLPDTKLTDEELAKIIVFLRYKKKSDVPAVKR